MIQDPFRSMIRSEGVLRYRDLPWRRTRDPYIIWLSEVMLQQTQVPRVETRMPAWLDRFPTVQALAQAAPSDVLDAWQGMGYNRRALALHRAAQCVMEDWDGEFPRETRDLVALPGIGPATAQGIRSFAFDLPGVYLETNVRTVFLHHFFPDVPAVPDRELVPLIQAACPAAPGTTADEIAPFAAPQDDADTPRAWYYALLDYGAYLKKTLPNPSRRSASYSRQSKFEARAVKSAPTLCACCWLRAMGGRRALRLMKLLQALTRWRRQPAESRSSASWSQVFLPIWSARAFAAPRAIVGGVCSPLKSEEQDCKV